MSNTLAVNALPMRTYRWLKMNTEQMAVDETLSFAAIESDALPALPDGITKKTGITRKDILSLFQEVSAGIRKGDREAIKPNGDAFVDSKQAIPTGMGLRIDALMEREEIDASLYTVAAGTKVAEPLSLRFSPEHETAALARQVLHVEKDAEVTVLIDYYTHRTFAGFFGIQTLLLLEEGARVHLAQVQMLGGGFTHFDDIGAVASSDASLDLVRLEFGSNAAFSGCAVNLTGDDASFTCEAAYLARRKQKYDYNYVATHRGKRTKGTMHFHGVLLDQSEKMLRGTIDFRAGASDADGEENEDVLLLSDAAINRTIPIILCQEENINGHHGATIGQLSDEMLFYMQSRGFSADEAKKLMIRAKIMRVMNLLPDGDLKSHVNAYLCDTL